MLSKQECETIVSQVDAAIVPSTRYDYMRAAARYAAAPLEAQLEAARRALNPRKWDAATYDLWNARIPDLQAAFDAIRNAALEATTPEKQG